MLTTTYYEPLFSYWNPKKSSIRVISYLIQMYSIQSFTLVNCLSIDHIIIRQITLTIEPNDIYFRLQRFDPTTFDTHRQTRQSLIHAHSEMLREYNMSSSFIHCCRAQYHRKTDCISSLTRCRWGKIVNKLIWITLNLPYSKLLKNQKIYISMSPRYLIKQIYS